MRKKLDALFTSAASVSSARFRIRYDGAADEPLGLAVLQVLDSAWDEYERRLGFAPTLPVTVVLQTATTFRDTTRAPDWAAAWNDGTIRVPVAGIDRPTPGLVQVLRHELAHSFVAARAGASCPTWLHEGLAQWLEGGDPEREDARLARLARRVPPAAPRVARAALRRDVGGGRHRGVRAEPVGGGPTAQERGRSRRAPFGRGPGPRAPRQARRCRRLWRSATASCSGPGRPTCAPPAASRRRRPRHQAFAERACKPDSVPAACAASDDHSSSPAVTRGVQQPTRGPRPGRPQTPPYSVLLRVGFSLPAVSPRRRCALTAPFHPCHPRGFPREFGGVFSVALSLGSPSLAVNQHAALWSPDFPPRPVRRRGDRPARSANTSRVAPSGTERSPNRCRHGLTPHAVHRPRRPQPSFSWLMP